LSRDACNTLTDFVPLLAERPHVAPGALANFNFIADPSGPLPRVLVPFNDIGLANLACNAVDFFSDKESADAACAALLDTPSTRRRVLKLVPIDFDASAETSNGMLRRVIAATRVS